MAMTLEDAIEELKLSMYAGNFIDPAPVRCVLAYVEKVKEDIKYYQRLSLDFQDRYSGALAINKELEEELQIIKEEVKELRDRVSSR
jgi:hypothetical protein